MLVKHECRMKFLDCVYVVRKRILGNLCAKIVEHCWFSCLQSKDKQGVRSSDLQEFHWHPISRKHLSARTSENPTVLLSLVQRSVASLTLNRGTSSVRHSRTLVNYPHTLTSNSLQFFQMQPDANHVWWCIMIMYTFFAQKMGTDIPVLLLEYWTKALETHWHRQPITWDCAIATGAQGFWNAADGITIGVNWDPHGLAKDI